MALKITQKKYAIQPMYYWNTASDEDTTSYFDSIEEAVEHYKNEWITDTEAVIVQKVAIVKDETIKNREIKVEVL